MVSKILFWGGFGLAVRFYQLGLEMRPQLQKSVLWLYPVYGSIGAAFGFWLQGVETKQMRYLEETKQKLLEKRKRRAERAEAKQNQITQNGEAEHVA